MTLSTSYLTMLSVAKWLLRLCGVVTLGTVLAGVGLLAAAFIAFIPWPILLWAAAFTVGAIYILEGWLL